MPPPTKRQLRMMARQGRRGDKVLGHLTPGEIVVPTDVQTPEVMQVLARGFGDAGLPLDRYTVAGPGDSENPETGQREYFDAEGTGTADSPGRESSDAPGGAEISGTESTDSFGTAEDAAAISADAGRIGGYDNGGGTSGRTGLGLLDSIDRALQSTFASSTAKGAPAGPFASYTGNVNPATGNPTATLGFSPTGVAGMMAPGLGLVGMAGRAMGLDDTVDLGIEVDVEDAKDTTKDSGQTLAGQMAAAPTSSEIASANYANSGPGLRSNKINPLTGQPEFYGAGRVTPSRNRYGKPRRMARGLNPRTGLSEYHGEGEMPEEMMAGEDAAGMMDGGMDAGEMPAGMHEMPDGGMMRDDAMPMRGGAEEMAPSHATDVKPAGPVKNRKEDSDSPPELAPSRSSGMKARGLGGGPKHNPKTGLQEFAIKREAFDTGFFRAQNPTLASGLSDDDLWNKYATDWRGAGHAANPEEQARKTAGYEGTFEGGWGGQGGTGGDTQATWIKQNPGSGTVNAGMTANVADTQGRVAPGVSNVARPTTRPAVGAPNTNFNESAASQMTAITNAQNPYMEAAKARGLGQANARGLMNSSIAVGAAEAEAAKAALPLALQDASTGAARNLEDQRFREQQALGEQTFGYDEYKADQDLRNRAALAAQGFGYDETLQGRDIGSREKISGNQLASAERISGNELSARRDISANELASRLQISTNDNDTRMALGNLDASTRVGLANIDTDRATTITSMNIGAGNRSQAISAAVQIQSNYTNMVNSITANPDIPADARNKYLTNASALMDSNLTLVEQLYNVDLTWTSANVQVAAA